MTQKFAVVQSVGPLRVLIKYGFETPLKMTGI